MYFAPACMKFRYEFQRIDRQNTDLLGKLAEVNYDFIMLIRIQFFENIE